MKTANALIMIVTMSCFANAANALVIYERPLENTNSGRFSNYSSTFPNQRVAGSFELDGNAAVSNTSWFGYFIPGSNISNSEFRISFYDANSTEPTVPGSTIYQTTVQPDITTTGLTQSVGDQDVQVLALSSDISQIDLFAGQRYWIEVAHLQNTRGSSFLWSRSTFSAEEVAVRSDDSAMWTRGIGSASQDPAYSLSGNTVSVP